MSSKGVKWGEGESVSTRMREPARDGPAQLSLPKLGGAEQLRQLVADYGGIDRVSHDFRLGSDLLNRYMVGQLEAPFSLLCALWWQTASGFRQAFAESHWSHQYNSFRRREAEAKVAHLEQVVAHAVRLLEHRADASDLVRQSLAHFPAKRLLGDPPKVGESTVI